jgi:hypothetical protein
VHCFAHQLQLTLVAVVKNHKRVCLFFQKVNAIHNVIGASCKRFNKLREMQKIKIVKAISNEEISTRSSLNQEMCLARPCDTRWISHYKTLTNLLKLFSVMIEVLEIIEEDGKYVEKQAEASGFMEEMRTFDFVFIYHLMHKSLGITYDLSQVLQRKSQDIVNVMCLVGIAKSRL